MCVKSDDSIRTIWTQDTAGYIYRMRFPENIRMLQDNMDGVCVSCQNAVGRSKIRDEKKTSPACQQYSRKTAGSKTEGSSLLTKIEAIEDIFFHRLLPFSGAVGGKRS